MLLCYCIKMAVIYLEILAEHSSGSLNPLQMRPTPSQIDRRRIMRISRQRETRTTMMNTQTSS